jgi:hypothetical protein
LKAGHLVTTLNLVGVANHFISNLAESTWIKHLNGNTP